MFIQLSKIELLDWQIWHYQKRISETHNQDAKNFLNQQLSNLLKLRNERFFNYKPLPVNSTIYLRPATPFSHN